MIDVKKIAADILELPELTAETVGAAFSAVGDVLAAMAERIDALEGQLRGES